MNESKAMILGVAGTELSAEETAFLRGERPWGFIVFARNIAGGEQLRELSASMRDCVGRPDAPVFVDQEGGRVQRLKPPLAPSYPSAAALGALYRQDRKTGSRAARLMSRLIAFDLARHGISSDCMPVLDVPAPGSHDVIGDRAYGNGPQIVAELGRAAAEGLLQGGVLPVVKHIPGHGRAMADSHKEPPKVDVPLEELRRHDFGPFKALRDMPMAMTAHVVYTAIDPDRPATVSRKVIDEIVRGEIGFEGLLLSDDLSMEALSGDFGKRAALVLEGGCDVVLHCNGAMDEMRAVAARTPELRGRALERAQRAMASVNTADDMDEKAARAEFARCFEAAA